MDKALDRAAALAAAEPFIDCGCAVHWLRPRDKMPVAREWSTAPVHTSRDADGGIPRWRQSRNPARRAVEDAGRLPAHHRPRHPQAGAGPRGVEGPARHVARGPHVPARRVGIGRREPPRPSDLRQAVRRPQAGRLGRVRDGHGPAQGPRGQEAGLGDRLPRHRQAGRPAAVHPSRHGRGVCLGRLAARPRSPRHGHRAAGQLRSRGVLGPPADDDDEDDHGDDEDEDAGAALDRLVSKARLGLSLEEIEGHLRKLPEEWVEDRDLWLNAGMAVHHETKGSVEGFDIWCEWSEHSGKFDIKDARRVWKSFKNRTRAPCRMPTIIQAAGRNRLALSFAEDDFDDDATVTTSRTPTASPTSSAPRRETRPARATFPTSCPTR